MRDYSSVLSRFITVLLNADLRLVAFFSATLVYACFGSPTPDVLSWVEVVVGGLIIFVVGAAGFMNVFGSGRGQGFWFLIGQCFLIYGLVFGLAGALVTGAGSGAIMRDILAFGFMFLPLFLIRFYATPLFPDLLKFSAVFIGLGFAVRAASPSLGLPFDVGYDALYYLGNSPLVLFAALFLLGLAIQTLSSSLCMRSLIITFACFMLFLMLVFPIALTSQRASLAAILVYGFLVFGFMLMHSPRRVIIAGSILASVIIMLFASYIGDVFVELRAKSDLVGANMRFEEWAAVWHVISEHPVSVLFGRGWGASFSSPAVADIEVTFTHGLLSSMLLKLGLLGFVLCAAYIGVLFLILLRSLKMHPVLVLAITAPFLIDTFLYAAFKSLDFGLLLAIIPVAMFANSKRAIIETKAPVLYEKA